MCRLRMRRGSNNVPVVGGTAGKACQLRAHGESQICLGVEKEFVVSYLPCVLPRCSFSLQPKAFLPGGWRVARKTQDAATCASTAEKLRELEDSLKIAYRSG